MTSPTQYPGSRFGFDQPISAVIIGGRGGVGGALSGLLADEPLCQSIVRTSRDLQWVSDPHDSSRERRSRLDLTDPMSVEWFGQFIASEVPPPNLIINCSGLLHDGPLQPERSFRHLDREQMLRLFDLHACGLSLLIKHLLPLVPRQGRSVFATLSARVGSIEDNRLGGWFSYRASKAAQNMILKTAAIEAARRWPDLALLALHPGTVDTPLSQPFTRRVPPEKLFQPDVAAAHLCRVITQRDSRDSGGFFAWDDSPIPW